MEIKGLNAWLARIERENALVLSQTMRELNKLTHSDESSANQLAEVIQRDATLATQLLKIANTVFYNPSSQSVTTISRAILIIGFDVIKSLCISIKLLETFLKDHPSRMLVETLADSIHSAVQSRNICVKMNSVMKEEVFVSGLLFHIAELLVLSTGEPPAKRLEAELPFDATQKQKDRLAERILGVSFTRMALALATKWHLGDTLIEALQPGKDISRKGEAVILGEELCRVLKSGVESVEYRDLLRKVSLYTGYGEKEVHAQIAKSAAQAKDMAAHYGSKELVALIPQTSEVLCDGTDNTNLLMPDSAEQLNILQKINSMMLGGINTIDLFRLVVQGLHEGVGLERVAIALFDLKREYITAKVVRGAGTETWTQSFKLKFDKSSTSLLQSVFALGSPVWIGGADFASMSQRVSTEYIQITGMRHFFLAPLKAGAKQVGVIYADMGMSKRSLNDTHFNGFRHFAMQSNMCLGVLASK
ncbi:MAG: HDOD domain-containing protein [Hahellaceae bacterium]|nr:HDOD domain-containing protein [Hahellaceae bacterium]